MRFVIASDIHGDAYWCERLVETYKQEKANGAEKLILLGDFLYHGPRNPVPEHYDPQKVAALLNPFKAEIVACRGNCEAEVDQWLLEFPVMAEYVPLVADGHTFFLTHGHHHSMENLPALQDGDFFLQGHTHIPVIREEELKDAEGKVCGKVTLGNPGSITFPKDGSDHSYMLYEDGILTLRTLEI